MYCQIGFMYLKWLKFRISSQNMSVSNKICTDAVTGIELTAQDNAATALKLKFLWRSKLGESGKVALPWLYFPVLSVLGNCLV